MTCVILISQRGSITDTDTVGVLEESLEIASSSLTTAYSSVWDPSPYPMAFTASRDQQQRKVDVSTDFSIDIVACPDGATPASLPPVRLRPPTGGAIGYSWQMSGLDGVIYAKLP
jgi:hypothetical protein